GWSIGTAVDRHEGRRAAAGQVPGAGPGGGGGCRSSLGADPGPGRLAGEARYRTGMTEQGTIDRGAVSPALADGERLSLGVAARLSRYLQVLTQARKMGRETI